MESDSPRVLELSHLKAVTTDSEDYQMFNCYKFEKEVVIVQLIQLFLVEISPLNFGIILSNFCTNAHFLLRCIDVLFAKNS